MRESVCRCSYSQYIDVPVTTSSMVLDLLFSLAIITLGLVLNLTFRKKLQDEKRNKPIERKGNVIEPIMRWYLIFVIIYWPYNILLLWITTNEIIPAPWFSNCWLLNMLYIPLRIGRVIIGYNSFFVALIRYLYIVHQQKSNNWDFKRVGKIFQMASIAVPLSMEVVRIFTEEDFPGFRSTERFRACVAINEGLNDTIDIDFPPPRPLELTMKYVPRQWINLIYFLYLTIFVAIGSNLIEGFMYMKIFQNIKK